MVCPEETGLQSTEAEAFKMPFFLGLVVDNSCSTRLELKLCLRDGFRVLGKVLGLELLSSELLTLIPDELDELLDS